MERIYAISHILMHIVINGLADRPSRDLAGAWNPAPLAPEKN
jgi:hypothetical protein